MNILITGGAGYIGTELVYKLAENDAIKSITVYDNLSRGNHNLFIGRQKLNSKVKFMQGELLDSRKLRQALKNIDVVYHLAAKVTTPFANIDGHIYEQVNHWGTAELVYATEESKAKKFIYISSVSVYGNKGKQLVNETTVPTPDSFYAISKYRGEQHVQRLSSKLNTLIIRLGNVYGYSKSMRFDAVINKFMFEAHYGNKLTISGSGDQHRSFIHIDNASAAIAQVAEKEIPSGTYNLTGKTFTINEVAALVNEIYMGVESLFINQQYPVHDLDIDTNFSLKNFIDVAGTNLEEELKEFKEEFSFVGE